MFHFLTDGRVRTSTRRARRPAVSQLKNVEALENRMCPTALFSAAVTAGVLNVTELAGNGSNVAISENAAHDTITVAGTGTTSINSGTSVSFFLPFTPINSIKVTYLNNTANDTLDVHDVSLPSSLTALLGQGNDTVDILGDTFNSVGVTAQTPASSGKDHVTIDTVFTSLINVTTANGAGSSVSLSNVTGNGKVTVAEGDGSGDSISVNLSAIGLTTLMEGNGGGDSIHVTNTTTLALTTTQGVGDGDSLSVDTVHAQSLTATQGNGSGDSIDVSNLHANSANLTQGDGPSDSLSLTASTLTGSATIVQGNGSSDSIDVSNLHANLANLTQGGGDFDSLTLTASTLTGSATIVQGNGSGDSIDVSNLHANSANLTQGDGNGDSLSLTASTLTGSATIVQGNGIADDITVDTVTSPVTLTIKQGDGGDTTAIESVSTGDLEYTGGAGINFVEAENVVAGTGTVDGGTSGFNVFDTDGTISGFLIVNFASFINDVDVG